MSAKKIKQKRFDIDHPSLITGWREKIDQNVWSKRHETLLRIAAEQEEVARIFVHFRIKEQMCKIYKASREFKSKPEPLWLRKLRPPGMGTISISIFVYTVQAIVWNVMSKAHSLKAWVVRD